MQSTAQLATAVGESEAAAAATLAALAEAGELSPRRRPAAGWRASAGTPRATRSPTPVRAYAEKVSRATA